MNVFVLIKKGVRQGCQDSLECMCELLLDNLNGLIVGLQQVESVGEGSQVNTNSFVVDDLCFHQSALHIVEAQFAAKQQEFKEKYL